MLRCASRTPDGFPPWALFGVPIAAMLTPAGIAWIEFVLDKGNDVFLLVAPETLDRSKGVWGTQRHGVLCRMWNGCVFLDRDSVRGRSAGWIRLFVRERVRLVYVAATRMVSVVRRGVSVDVVALPAAHDIAATRFGIALDDVNVARITCSSAGACVRACLRRVHELWVLCSCVICARARCATRREEACTSQRTTSCRTCDSSRAPA